MGYKRYGLVVFCFLFLFVLEVPVPVLVFARCCLSFVSLITSLHALLLLLLFCVLHTFLMHAPQWTGKCATRTRLSSPRVACRATLSA